MIDVGVHDLLEGSSGQVVEIYATGTDLVTGFNLQAQLGNGVAPPPEPIFQSIDFSGGLWDAYPHTVMGGPLAGAEMYAQASVAFNEGVQVVANGLIATLVIDTSGFAIGESFALKLSDTDIGQDSDFIVSGGGSLAPQITNGTINIVSGAARITAPVTDDQVAPLEEAAVGAFGDGMVGGLYGIWLKGEGATGDPDYRWSISGGPEGLISIPLATLPDTDLDGNIDDYFLRFAQLVEIGAIDRNATAAYTLTLEALDGGGLPISGSGSEILLLIPEPATLSLLALGGLAVIRRRRLARIG
jgi:hypothetical protein